MFDSDYFRTTLPRDVETAGGSPVVEVLLLSGHVHRVRAVLDAGRGTVTLSTFQIRGDLTHERPRFGAPDAGDDLMRAVVSYESIAAVVIDPSPSQTRARPGFA